jgi:predicted ATP-dependent endonuclease of OLD family
MKLKQFTVREFRSFWDSGPIKIDDQTRCLVGKNEAGKIALLTRLYRNNQIVAGDTLSTKPVRR